jgi:hypothetical protein
MQSGGGVGVDCSMEFKLNYNSSGSRLPVNVTPAGIMVILGGGAKTKICCLTRLTAIVQMD